MNLALPLAKAAVLMVLFMVPGFVFRKIGKIDGHFSLVLSQMLVYIAQPALMISSYLREYDSGAMKEFAGVGIVTLCVLLFGFFFSNLAFPKRIPESKRKVLRFGTIFCNTGNMGIPLVIYTLGSEYAFYVQAALLVFNFVVFSLGRYLYSGNRKHISVLGSIINPGMLPSLIGLLIYVTGLGGWIVEATVNGGAGGFAAGLVTDTITGLSTMVAPLSMIVIGVRLAELSLKDLFSDYVMYYQLFLRLFVMPCVATVFSLLLRRTGIISPEIHAMNIIVASTPCAALTAVMAELYDCDSVYGSKLVAVSTLLSVVTMPIVITILG